MHVRDAMSSVVLTVGPTHTLRQAAKAMAERKVGAAVVLDPDADGPGILTERDLLEAVAQGQDLDVEVCSDHLTPDAVTAMPDWDLDKASIVMMRGGFRHLVVCEDSDVVGVLSVRDIVRVYQERGQLSA